MKPIQPAPAADLASTDLPFPDVEQFDPNDVMMNFAKYIYEQGGLDE